MDSARPSRRMRLPSPARAATAAGILLATSVLLLAGDLTVVQMAGDEAHAVPFYIQNEDFTVAGMRITNAGGGDLIQAFEMFSQAACGYAYRNPVLVPYTPSNDSANDTRLYFRDANGTAWTSGNLTAYLANARVAGNVTFYVVESVHTPDLLRGEDVAAYRESRREADLPQIHLREVNRTIPEDEAAGDDVVVRRSISVRVSVGCQGGLISIERGPHPGVNVRYSFSSSEPWLDDLPVHQGVDFLYVLRADEQKDNETYALLADNLRNGGEFWTYSMMHATVFDDEGLVPDRILRAAIVVTLGAAVVLLALAMRRHDGSVPPMQTDAAFAVAAAGESHLLRLRRTWGLVGALLIPLLAAATYVVFAVVPFTAPTPAWNTTIGALVLVLDAAVLALWGLAFRRAHQDLVAWRKAWTRLDGTGLDDL